jgi:P-type E1-E2 ATPase
MHLMVLEAKTAAEVEHNMDKMLHEMESMPESTVHALVVPGNVLTFVFAGPQQKKFLEIGTKCHSVICSRVSPLQKAMVVKLVKDNNKGTTTLAIGDGANDVSMIQAAHVGVGIAGREGTQAVRASDYAFGEFRHLRRLLSVHGRYSYMRMAGLIYYSFYKNIVFITIQWWFGFVSAWTGQVC